MVENWLQIIAEQGLLGVLLILMGYAYYKKDQRVKELSDERSKLQQEFQEALSSIQEKRIQENIESKAEAIAITNKVNELVDTLSKLTNKKL